MARDTPVAIVAGGVRFHQHLDTRRVPVGLDSIRRQSRGRRGRARWDGSVYPRPLWRRWAIAGGRVNTGRRGGECGGTAVGKLAFGAPDLKLPPFTHGFVCEPTAAAFSNRAASHYRGVELTGVAAPKSETRQLRRAFGHPFFPHELDRESGVSAIRRDRESSSSAKARQPDLRWSSGTRKRTSRGTCSGCARQATGLRRYTTPPARFESAFPDALRTSEHGSSSLSGSR